MIYKTFLALGAFLVLLLAQAEASSNCTLSRRNIVIDLQQLDWPVWNFTSGQDLYQISLCQPIDASGPCDGSYLCRQTPGNGKAEKLLSDKTPTELTRAFGDTVRIWYQTNHECKPGKKTEIIITLACGPTLGIPEMLRSEECTYDIIWTTSAVCRGLKPVRQTPCYIIDENHQIYNLQILSLVTGAYPAVGITEKPRDRFYINVCREIQPDEETGPCPPGSGACLKRDGDVLSWGVPDQRIVVEKGAIYLRYREPNKIPVSCTLSPTTTVIFKCPGPDEKSEAKPKLHFTSDCQYELIWTTSYACPIIATKGSTQNCSIPLKEGQRTRIVDLSSLNQGGNFVVSGKMKKIKYDWIVKICGPVENESRCKGLSEDTSACMVDQNGNATSVGTTSNSELVYENGQVLLSYISKETCLADKKRMYSTSVSIVCDRSVVKPTMTLEGAAPCTYIMKIATPLICPRPSQCEFSANGSSYNMNVLSREGEAPWSIITIEKGLKLFFNPCGNIAPMEDAEHCSPSKPFCLIRDGNATSVGVISGLPKAPDSQLILQSYTDVNDKCENGQMRIDVWFKCNPSTLLSYPYSQKEKDDCNMIIIWETVAACPLGISRGTKCVIKDASRGINMDLSELQSSTYYRVPGQNNDEYYINACGPVRNAPCTNSSDVGACKLFKESNGESKSLELGKSSSDILYTSGVVKLIYKNDTFVHKPIEGVPGVSIKEYAIKPQIDGVNIDIEAVEQEEKKEREYNKKMRVSVSYDIISLPDIPGTTMKPTPNSGVLGTGGNVRMLRERAEYLNNFDNSDDDEDISIGRGNNDKPTSTLTTQDSITTEMTTEDTTSTEATSTEEHKSTRQSTSESTTESTTTESDITEIRTSTTLPSGPATPPYDINVILNDHEKEVGWEIEKNNLEMKKAVIDFICEPNAGKGSPTFFTMDGDTYKFEWHTALACPKRDLISTPSNCKVVDPKTGKTYDLTQLSTVDTVAIGTSNTMVVNFCRSLINPPKNCSSSDYGCIINRVSDKQNKTQSLGKPVGEPRILDDGNLQLVYSGAVCNDNTTMTTNTTITLTCASGKWSLPYVDNPEPCNYLLNIPHPAACPVEEVRVNNSKSDGKSINCTIMDPVTGQIFNLNSLATPDGYSVLSRGENYTVNICAPVANSACGHPLATACLRGSNASTPLALTEKAELTYVNRQLSLIYKGSDSTGKSSNRVKIMFRCNLDTVNNPLEVAEASENNYMFAFSTPIVCPTKKVPCKLVQDGMTYDLSPLARINSNYDLDITDPERQQKLKVKSAHINLCRPLNPVQHKKCPEGPIHGCLHTTTSDDGLSLGSVSKLIVDSDGVYFDLSGGSPCPSNPKEPLKTSISITCAENTTPLKLSSPLDSSCWVLLSMTSPFACPIMTATQTTNSTDVSISESNCTVINPDTEEFIDLNLLSKESGAWTANDTTNVIMFNPCKPLNVPNMPDYCKDKSLCVIENKNPKVSAGSAKVNGTIRYSKNGPEMVLYSLNTNGRCKEMTYTIRFRCDPEKDTLMTRGVEGCTVLLTVLSTKLCKTAAEESCRFVNPDTKEVVNLKSLSLKQDSYVIHSVNKSRLYALKVCGSAHSVELESVIPCPIDSGACMKITDDNNQTSILSLGGISTPKWKNNMLELVYEDGDICEENSSKNLSAIIRLKCYSTIQFPIFLWQESCQVMFEWETPAACPLGSTLPPSWPSGEPNTDTNDLNTEPPSLLPCVGKDIINNHDYDLRSLSKQPWNITAPDYNMTFYVCDTAEPSVCGDKAGGCVSLANSSEPKSLGLVNGKLEVRKNLVVLEYMNGDKCPYNQGQMSLRIVMTCSPTAMPPIRTNLRNKCGYTVTWKHPLACETKMKCRVTGDNQVLDLTSLMSRPSLHVVKSMDAQTNDGYLLEMCNPVLNYKCPSGSLACMVPEDKNKKPLSLGTVGQINWNETTNTVAVTYSLGSACNVTNLNYSTYISVTCDPHVGKGNPMLMSYNTETCQYKMVWRTDRVCPKTLMETLANVSCIFKSDSMTMDFSALSSTPNDAYQVYDPKRETNLKLSLCGVVNTTGSCSTAASCLVEKSGVAVNYGNPTSMTGILDGNILKIRISGGSACKASASKTRETVIKMVCDIKGGPGKPVLEEITPCHALITWRTRDICDAYESYCNLVVGDKNYDLRKISSISHEWSTNSSNGNMYYINVCRHLTHKLGCPTDAAICTMDSKGKPLSLGSHTSMKASIDGSGKLVMNYDNGDSCSSNKNISSIIMYKCGSSTETPVLVDYSEKECFYVFEWTTHVVCNQAYYNLKVSPDHQAVDIQNGLSYNLTSVYGRSLEVTKESTETNETMYYYFDLASGVPECKNSPVCLKTSKQIGSIKSDQQYLLGSRDTLRVMKLNDTKQVSIHASSNDPCPQNPNLKSSVLINLICHKNTPLGYPNPKYVTEECVYVFDWAYSGVCNDNAKTVDKPLNVAHSQTPLIIILVILLILLIVVPAAIILSSQRRRETVCPWIFKRKENVSFDPASLANSA